MQKEIKKAGKWAYVLAGSDAEETWELKAALSLSSLRPSAEVSGHISTEVGPPTCLPAFLEVIHLSPLP